LLFLASLRRAPLDIFGIISILKDGVDLSSTEA